MRGLFLAALSCVLPAGGSAAAARAAAAGLPGLRLSPLAYRLAAPVPTLPPLGAARLPGSGLLPGPLPAAAVPAAPALAPAPAPAVMNALQDIAGQAAVRAEGRDGQALNGFFDGAGLPGGAPEAADSVADDFGSRFRVPFQPRGRVDLARSDPDRTPGMKHRKAQAADRLSADQKALDELQQRLYAEGKRSVLIVLQAMDTGGKDGTIRWVLGPLNPQGFKVSGFKKPSAEEAEHPYLWRIRKALPGPGIIGVFNRSHYEDILVPTVYKTLPEREVAGRYEEINAFEKELADRGVLILKFFLHISKAEQKRRLQERLDTPEKLWKFSAADLESRKKWDEFQEAYGGVLARTSTPWAPWHVIPANKKWFRNYAVGRIIREAMEKLDPQYPQPTVDPKSITIPD